MDRTHPRRTGGVAEPPRGRSYDRFGRRRHREDFWRRYLIRGRVSIPLGRGRGIRGRVPIPHGRGRGRSQTVVDAPSATTGIRSGLTPKRTLAPRPSGPRRQRKTQNAAYRANPDRRSPSGPQALDVSQFYLVKRMIRGLGAETISTYSQTLNG